MRPLCLLLAACTAPPTEVSAEVLQRGRQLYEDGLSPRGDRVEAVLLSGPTPGTALPCASCHGPDGAGRREGGIEAPDVRAGALAQLRQVGRRTRPAYTAATLRRAVTLGVDSGGQPLDSVMPRYRLSDADADDLVAWLGRLGAAEPAGPLQVGLLAPALLRGWLEELVAAQPALYGRELQVGGTEVVALVAPWATPEELAALPPDLPVVGPSGPGAAFYVPASPPSPLAPPCPAPLDRLPAGVDPGAAARGASSVLLLVDALSRAGRDPDRRALVRALEHTQSLHTGCTGRLDYGPGRHAPTDGVPR